MTQNDWQDEVLGFWFGELAYDDWFKSSAELDERITQRFGAMLAWFAGDPPSEARTDPRAALAAIILFDQFPRNMHRGKAEAFATDDIAVELARNALDKGFDAGMNADERSFLYMPLMHSEVLADQERCVDLFRTLGNEGGLKYAIEHRDIIAQFGRFPHRNRALGRRTTPAEEEFMRSHPGYGQ